MPSVLHRQAEAGRHGRPGGALRASLRTSGQQGLNPRDDDRHGRLRAAKLRALAATRSEPIDAWATSPLTNGATLDEGGTGRAWVLIDDGDPVGLVPALVWAQRRDIHDLQIVVETGLGAGIVARRAGLLARPPTVWRVDGRSLVVAPPGAEETSEVDPAALDAAAPLADHGILTVVEHGTVRGEVLGLEVARVVAGADGAWRLEVGTGRHDREARAEMRVGQDLDRALAEIAAVVTDRRRPGVARHPANTLARERWLRALLVARPDLAGAAYLEPVAAATPRDDLRLPAPAPALGADADGTPVVVVASAGFDPDLVPAAADVRRREAPAARLRLVVPDGDDHAVTRRMVDALADPAEVRTVPAPWRPGGAQWSA